MDLDLVELGLTPGAVYRARLSAVSQVGHSEEFDFKVCEESAVLSVEVQPIPGVLTHKRYIARLQTTVDAPLVATLWVEAPGFNVNVPLVKVGDLYQATVVAPQLPCDEENPQNGEPLKFRARVVRADGLPLRDEGGACFDLKRDLYPCENSLRLTPAVQSCETAVPGQDRISVAVRSREPGVPVVLRSEEWSTAFVTGDEHCEYPEPEHLYCDARLITIDTAGWAEGPELIKGEMGPETGPVVARDEETITIDHTAPVMDMHQPEEGGGLCVERDGVIELARLKFTIEDAAPKVEVRGVWRRYGDGEWLPMCVGDDCEDTWGEPATSVPIEKVIDVREWLDGEHALRFELCDGDGNRTTFERRFTLFRGATAISIEGVENREFSPNGDGELDVSRVTVRLPQALRLTVQVRQGGPEGVVLRTLADEQTFPAGDRTFTWDGRDDAGTTVVDGEYFLVASGTNACGGSDTRWTRVRVDVTPPTVQITSPTAGAIISVAADVRGRAIDTTFASYQLFWGAGASPTIWNLIWESAHPVGSATTTGHLGYFQAQPQAGPYTLRLFARDRARNEAETRVTVEVDERSFLDRFVVAPRVFSPNGDGRRDSASIEYVLLAAGRVTLVVADPQGAIVRSLENEVERTPGTYVTAWDGLTAAGTQAPDGDYRVDILVQATTGGGSQHASAEVTLDRTPPTIAITTPAVGADVQPNVAVHGSIQDVNLVEYVIEAARLFSPPVELARGNENAIDLDLAALHGLSDGPFDLVVRAQDAGENATEVRVPFTLDSVAPQAQLLGPLPGDVVARGATPIPLVGTAQDLRLESWDVAFGPGAQPAWFVPVASGTQGGTGLALGDWNVASLADGTFTLRLIARDRAGHSSESRAIVILDGLAPEAVIGAPAEGAYVGTPPSIDGTASDANLERWQLEAAPGDAASAFQWSPVASGTTSVTTGPLGEWNPLPPDGVHTLRLTVDDRADHVSTTLRTVTIDTTPPSPPSGLSGVTENPTATTADIRLSWTASASTDVVGYRVARVGGAVLQELLAATTHLDPALVEGLYPYEVQAVDRAGNRSASVTTSVRVDLTPPIADILVPAAGARVSGSVDVRGTAYSPDDFGRFRLLAGVGTAPSAWTLVRESTVPVAAGVLGTWEPTAPGPHVLALEAEDQYGNVARDTVAVEVDHLPPSPPHLDTVAVAAGAPATLIATWSLSPSTDVQGYLVYRNDRLANASGVVIGDLRPYLVPGPSYTDAGLPDGTHRYRIVAMDEAGNVSAPSNEVPATLDNRRPHAELVEPPAGLRFEFPIRLLATTPDLDVSSVLFQVQPAAGGAWVDIGTPDTTVPYERTLDPIALAPGVYRLRAVASDPGGPDPSPTQIEVTYGDATAPAPPTNLVGHSDGDTVTLSWSASPEPDIAGYHVYRDGERLTTAPQPTTTFVDTRDAGMFEYAVTTLDADGNQSLPATVEVTLYRPTLRPVVPPTTDGPTVGLGGSGSRGGTIEIVREGAVVAQAASTSGSFTVPSVPLAPGPNVLVARERIDGRASLSSSEIVVILNAPPPAVTGLAAQVADHQVALSWDAQASVFGYRLTRDGVPLTEAITPQVWSTTASDTLPGYDPQSAIDGYLSTLWLPMTAGPSYWEVQVAPTALMSRVTIAFANPEGPVEAPAHRISAEWNGRLLPLVEAGPGGGSSVDHTLALPFATTRLRIELSPTSYVGVAEVGIEALQAVPAETPAWTESAPDGVHVYDVAAIDGFGSSGPAGSLAVPVGDVVAPPVPTGLVATVTGSDVALSWDAVSAPDLAGYVVRRDGAAIATVPTTSHLDGGRPNGTYTYTVRSRDAVGNESADSAPAVAVVAVAPPVAPVLSATAAADGTVELAWTHPGAPHFVVARAIVAGGPYATVARTGSVAAYTDGDVRPGERVYYVVRAEDALGNLSPASNEASALPLMPRPVLLRPTDADHPLELAATRATFDGRAFPDALVALTVNGELRGAAVAGRALEPTELASLPPRELIVQMSPNGRYLGLLVYDPVADTYSSLWRDLLTGGTGTLPPGTGFHAFSPDERRLAFLIGACGDPGCSSDLGVLDLATGATTIVEDGPRDTHESIWSPSGEELAILTSEVGASAMRLDVVELATGATRLVAEWPDAMYALRWSPTGADIAALRRIPGESGAELAIHPSTGVGTTRVAPEVIGNDAPEWVGGISIIYQTTAGSLHVWNLDTGVVEELVVEGSQPRLSRSGRYFSYFRSNPPVTGDLWLNSVIVRDGTGAEQEVSLSPSQSGPAAPSLHQWMDGDFLALASERRLDLLAPFDGAFRVPDVPLDPGVNVVEVEAIETQTGGISDPSEPVTITTPLDAYPDLGVSAADLASYPAVPLVGQPMALSARVRNLGLAPASNVSVRLELRGPAGTLLDQTVTLSSIPAGGSAVASAYWTATVPGTYLLRAEADPDGTVSESNEANNAAEAGIHVTAASELVVTASTDHASYPAHAPVRVHVDLANGGGPWSGTVRTDVVTAAGALVAALDARPVSVGYGQTATIDLLWNTSAHLAGDYAVRVRALVGDVVTATDDAPFAIDPDTGVWARVTPADPTIPVGSAAQLAARVENRGANTTLAGASARLSVLRAGATAYEATAPLPTLPPGGAWDGAFEWSPATPAGTYAVRLQVLAADGSVLTAAEAVLEVQAAAGLSGTLALSPTHVLVGTPVSALATVTNLGPEPLVAHPFVVEVRSGATVLVGVPFTLDIPGGATRTATVSLPTDVLPFGPHPVFLRAAGAAASLHRETLHVHAPIVAPSIDAPADGATVATDHPVLSVNDATTPSGAALTYAFEIYRDAALTMPLPGASNVPETPLRTAWTVAVPLEEDARYWWRARATDGFSNSPWTSAAAFRVDAQNTAPGSPRTESPRDGDTVATLQPQLVAINAFDPDPELLTYDFRLARDLAMADVVASVTGVPETATFTRWTVPSPLDEGATYYWSVRARDPHQPSPWASPARFVVQAANQPPSAVPLLYPDDEGEVDDLTIEMFAGAAVDPEGDALTYRFEIDRVPTFDSPDRQASPELVLASGEVSWKTPLPLTDNAYAYWRVAARDAHASGPWTTRRFFVNLANEAPGAPIPIAPGAGTVVATPTPALRVQNALDPDLDLLTYEFEVRTTASVLVASIAGVPQGVAESLWTVAPPLAENTAYTWRARAHDGALAGPWSEPTPFSVNAVNDPPTAPTLVSPAEGAVLTAPPADLVVANATSPDLLDLTYDFELYSVPSSGPLVLVDSATGVPSGSLQTAWSPTAAMPAGSYSWRARAVDVHQPGPWMDSAHFTIAPTDKPPAAPTGLRAVAGDRAVLLSWNPNTEADLTGYRVYRGTTPGGPYAFVTATTQTSLTDTGLVNGQPVYYVVTATDAANESAHSAEASATPHSGPLGMQIAFWPAVIEGECSKCPGTPPAAVPHFGPLKPVLECVLDEGGTGATTAFFGFDNAAASALGVPVGPANTFTPAPAGQGQPVVFPRGRSAEFPGVFGVPFTSPELSWTLDGQTATAVLANAVALCPIPPIKCGAWLYATIEPPAGHDPASIELDKVALDGVLPADQTYQAIVDRDGDGLPELEVRFEQDKVWPDLRTGPNSLTVAGELGDFEFQGTDTVVLSGLKARGEFTPNIFRQTSGHPQVSLKLRGCYVGAAIDTSSIRLNGVLPIRRVVSSTNQQTVVEFDHAAARALLPVGDRVEVVVTGLSSGQPFRSVDHIKVRP
ncbi:MAG: CARDB domain-containing protein [Vicinamibacteria bacterium]